MSRPSAARRSSSLEQPLGHPALETVLDAPPCALERGVVDVAADDLAAALEQNLGDARPHRPQADDAGARDCFHGREP